MISGEGWHALYAARTPEDAPDFTATTRVPVAAWVGTDTSSSRNAVVHGYIAQFGRAALSRVDDAEFTGADGRPQTFVMYLRSGPGTDSDADADADAYSNADDED